MHFIRFWKPYFVSIIIVGLFFILWDIYFAYHEVWGFNYQYLVGWKIFELPIEEWMFFLLIPYASNFIHYSLEFFFPRLQMNQKTAHYLTWLFFVFGLIVTVVHMDRTYTVVNFGVFTLLMLAQIIFRFPYIRRFYLSFVLIYIPFFFVNSALTGSYSENPVVFYDNAENLGIRVGTMPLEDSFYCFSMLYGNILLFEYLRRKWNYCTEINVKRCEQSIS